MYIKKTELDKLLKSNPILLQDDLGNVYLLKGRECTKIRGHAKYTRWVDD